MSEATASLSALPAIPIVYQEFWDVWTDPQQRSACLAAYASGERSFVPHLLPEQLLQLAGQETLDLLRQRFGAAVDLALDPTHTDPDQLPTATPDALHSPVADQPDSQWLKQSNMVGVNIRTIGSFWHLVKYALSLPTAQDSIHILPIWEPGVAGSIYGMRSWQLNPEFYSDEFATLCPWLDTIDKQLRAVAHLLHVMGKTVGMDVIPHTDRYSEIVLANPAYFEWLQRQDTAIVDHSANLHAAVETKIWTFLLAHGPAIPDDALPETCEMLFSTDVDEARRCRLLFGPPADAEGRQARRNQLMQHLYRYGYEPVPATMAPPFRGITVDLRPEARSVDAIGQVWREYTITDPTPMSRVFGPLTRYKLYDALDDNANWAIDWERPRHAVWQYVCEHYYALHRRFGFDFIRGDMAHVQMRSDGVPGTLDRYYDILGAVKQYIQHDHGVPYFGYFAETFLPPRDVFGYGEEIDHLEAADADTTLGDLQSTPVGSPAFLRGWRYYLDLQATRLCIPNFTMMTSDKDDPRFDQFYLHGNAVRLFIALFLLDTPSYMGIGFETRDVHYSPAPNEHYTKLFVFQERGGPKATQGPYVWGQNGLLYSTFTRMKQYLDPLWPRLKGQPTRWLIPPDATAENRVVAWTQQGASPSYVLVANTHGEQAAMRFAIPWIGAGLSLHCEYSTVGTVPAEDQLLLSNGKHYKVTQLAADEARVYRVERGIS